jgi:hypothetical protein
MLIGAAEAAMMIEEGLFEQPGDVLAGFFGLPEIRIVGILEPTGTLLDEYHVVSSMTLDRMNMQAEVRTVVAGGEIKLFYDVRGDNLPAIVSERVQTDQLRPARVGEGAYVPMYIGSIEAGMMIEENMFRQEGDLIRGLFGNDVIVAGILPKTNTPLDLMHLISAEVSLQF